MEHGPHEREETRDGLAPALTRDFICELEEERSGLATVELAAARTPDVLSLSLWRNESCCEGELLLEPRPSDVFTARQSSKPPYVEAEYVETTLHNEHSLLPKQFELGTGGSRFETALSVGQRLGPQAPRALPETEKHVVFSVAGAHYAVPMKQVLELGGLEHFTPVPNLPAWVLGITNLRGDIISVIDLRVLLGLAAHNFPARSLLVVETLDGALTTCLLVERVQGMANVLSGDIQKQDRLLRDGLTPYTRGVYTHEGEPLSVLNLERLLRSLTLTH